MHTATDNANELITGTRVWRTGSPGEITRNTEIVGGADVLLTRAKPFETRSNTMTDTHAIAVRAALASSASVVDVEFPDRIPPLQRATVEEPSAGQGARASRLDDPEVACVR